jgi:hypothetical protein
MKYGKALIGLLAIVTDLYDNVEPGTTVKIKSLSPFVGIFNVDIIDGVRAGETALIHSTRLKEGDGTAANTAATTQAVAVKKAELPTKQLQIVKINELCYAVRKAVIERNRKVNLRNENFRTELEAFIEEINSATVFNAHTSYIVCELYGPNAGLGIKKQSLGIDIDKLTKKASMRMFANPDQLRIGIEIEPVKSNPAIGYFYDVPRSDGDIERWTQSGPDNFDITLDPIDGEDPANETYAKGVVDAFEIEFKRLTEICKAHYRAITDKYELITSDTKVEEALKDLWYLETGDVVPQPMLEMLGIK